MLINKHDCYNLLFEMQSNGINVQDDISQLMKNDIVSKNVVKHLIDIQYPTVMFYIRLNNKAHKIIKEILTCDNKPISNFIKIATSIITQAIIAIEHECDNDINMQNELINSLRLSELSAGLNKYFSTGDSSLLVQTVMLNRLDVKDILD